MDLHGSAGSLLASIAVLLGLDALSLGLGQLRRPSNAVALGVRVLAIGKGLPMEGDWLEEGQLQLLGYGLHLGSWRLLTVAVLAHLGAIWTLGGWSQAHWMFSRKRQAKDWPKHWSSQLRRWLDQWDRNR